MDFIIRAIYHLDITHEFNVNADTGPCIYLKQQIKFTQLL
jgi:hypothetical protein